MSAVEDGDAPVPHSFVHNDLAADLAAGGGEPAIVPVDCFEA